jgi:hypothetical protein
MWRPKSKIFIDRDRFTFANIELRANNEYTKYFYNRESDLRRLKIDRQAYS